MNNVMTEKDEAWNLKSSEKYSFDFQSIKSLVRFPEEPELQIKKIP